MLEKAPAVRLALVMLPKDGAAPVLPNKTWPVVPTGTALMAFPEFPNNNALAVFEAQPVPPLETAKVPVRLETSKFPKVGAAPVLAIST